MKKLIILFCSVAIILSVAAVASAIPIGGELYWAKPFSSPSFNFATATSVPQMSTSSTVGLGHLAPLTGKTITTSGFSFNPASNPAANPLWTAGGFSFILNTVSITVQDGLQLGLSGIGTLSSLVPGSGLDPSIFAWNLNITGGSAGFSFSQSNVPVPEPATMLLMGTGLAGLAVVVRRRKVRKA